MLKKFASSIAFVIFILLWIKVIDNLDHFLVIRDYYGGKTLTGIGWFVFACIVAPLLEELVFRKVPMDFAKKYRKTRGVDYTLPIAVISSWIFASIHNNAPYNELLQGVGGFGLCLLYIRNNYSYWFNVLAHAGWNISVLYLIPFFEKIW